MNLVTRSRPLKKWFGKKVVKVFNNSKSLTSLKGRQEYISSKIIMKSCSENVYKKRVSIYLKYTIRKNKKELIKRIGIFYKHIQS